MLFRKIFAGFFLESYKADEYALGEKCINSELWRWYSSPFGGSVHVLYA
jgi:hypothetical protein